MDAHVGVRRLAKLGESALKIAWKASTGCRAVAGGETAERLRSVTAAVQNPQAAARWKHRQEIRARLRRYASA
jgi:hypothetical protein